MDNSQQNQLTIPPEIRSFLEGILTEAQMLSLDDEMKEEMLKELYARLDNYLATVILENLPAEHYEEFIKLNEEKKPQAEIEQFLQDKMPNPSQVFAKAFADFRELYLGSVAVARNAPEATADTANSQTVS